MDSDDDVRQKTGSTYGMTDGTEMMSEKGKEILSHAYHSDHCVLEFKTREDGSTVILDITDHVEQLEEIVEAEQ